MTKNEAIKTVEDWLAKLNSPNESEATVATCNPPKEAIRRVIREAKGK